MHPVVHILILAAGASSRMRGRDKLLQPIRGKPILRMVVDMALATGAPVMVTLPPASGPRRGTPPRACHARSSGAWRRFLRGIPVRRTG